MEHHEHEVLKKIKNQNAKSHRRWRDPAEGVEKRQTKIQNEIRATRYGIKRYGVNMWKTYDFKSQKVGEKGKVLNKNIYKCGFCSGKRFVPSKRNIVCPVCLGNGAIKIKPPVVICAYCNGSGKSKVNADLVCSVCRGKGVVSVPTAYVETCSVCRGSGREKESNLPCLKCKGKGVKEVQKRVLTIYEGGLYNGRQKGN